MMKQTAKQNLLLFNQISDEQQDAMLDTMHQVASGQTLYDIQEQNSTMRPFQGLRHFGRKVGNWLVRAVNFFDAIAIAIDEKMIRKAFDPDLGKNSTFSSHYVSRYRSYLPSLMVEVAGLIRPGRLAQIVAHFFPSPQKRMLKGKRQPLRKDEYLLSFLSELQKLYGHLPLLADANYATQKLVSWLVDKKWPFVMRLNSRKAILKPIKVKFENNSVLKFVDEWIFDEEYGGFVRVLAYRRMWKDARNPKFKYKTYYWITNLDWGSHSIVELYRSRWCLENSFKALKLLDKTPGLNVDLICGYFAMTFHVMGSLCYELRSSTKTLSRLMSLELSLTRTEKTVEMCWNDIPTRFARKLLLWVYYRPLLVKSISLVI